ncbi:MAG: hypothetical protein V5B32_13910 [Candidatus Accumulibacter sp. UW26]|jgi:hypothetical protein
MSEFHFNCEQFLAIARQHFFAGDLGAGFQQDASDEDSTSACGETMHRAHAG